MLFAKMKSTVFFSSAQNDEKEGEVICHGNLMKE